MATKPTHDPAPAEDYRITNARRTLAESMAAVPGEVDSAHWWGRMEHTVETLLAVIAEGQA